MAHTPDATSPSEPHPAATQPDTTPRDVETSADVAMAAAPPANGPDSNFAGKLAEWKQILVHVKDAYTRDHVPLIGAGVAFYALLAIVPALVALVSVYGLVATPEQMQHQITNSLSAAPVEVQNLLRRQVTNIVETDRGGLGIRAAFGIALSLWSASSGMKHLISAINAAYNEEETRGYFKLRITALLMTVGAIAGVLVAFATIAVLPAIMRAAGVGSVGHMTVSIVRWPLLGVLMLGGLSVLYRYGADHKNPHWKLVETGSIIAVIGFIVTSLLFAVYTANFASFGETYGSLGSVIVVMLWLMITSTVIILGAELNSEAERQARYDDNLTATSRGTAPSRENTVPGT